MNATRTVALKIASLGRKDRDWILRRLTPDEHRRIAAPLSVAVRLSAADLRDVLPDPGNLGVGRVPRADPVRNNVTHDTTDIEVICAAPLDRLMSVLESLDPVARALLLEGYDWPWLPVYLERQHPRARKSLSDILQGIQGRTTPKLASLILQNVAQRLRPVPAPEVSRSWFEEILTSTSLSQAQDFDMDGVNARGKRESRA